MTKTRFNGSRLGYLLTEEETEKVSIIMDYMDMTPHEFLSHCIDTLWRRLHEG